MGCVLSADVFARYSRQLGKRVLYVCGTDEYGTATETKALEEKCTPKELCDKYHKLHKECYEWFDIDFDFFGRTSTPQQTKITHEIFNDLKNNGYIQKRQIEQFKCPKCNMFLSDRFVIGTCHHKECGSDDARGDQCNKCGKLINALELINPKCKLCGSTPEKASTFHLFLELPNIEEKLKPWIAKASEEGEWSANSKSITYSFISEGLKGRCITRDLKWGTPVPSDDPDLQNKVFYVWFDAPIGYLSITANLEGDKWETWWKDPEHVKYYEFMGKDNVTFHTVIFPSTLLGTGKKWTLLHHLSTTEFLNYEGTKFSKSKNIGVFGDQVQSTGIPPEVWRYYLLSMRPEVSDTDFRWDEFQAKNNNELLNNMGNLFNRVLVFINKNFEGKVPKFTPEKFTKEEDIKFLKDLLGLFNQYINYQNKTCIKDALRILMEISALGNGFLQLTTPWTLLKKNSPQFDEERASTLFYVFVALCRLIGALAEPFIPSFSAKFYEIMNIKYEGKELTVFKTVLDYIEANKGKEETFLINCGLIEEGHSINTPHPLFKKISDKEIQEFKAKFGTAESAK
ncbi:MAG: methionine--tRNA ligase [archaeon]|nr:methionine--tRNA ligase [archaeon]